MGREKEVLAKPGNKKLQLWLMRQKGHLAVVAVKSNERGLSLSLTEGVELAERPLVGQTCN